MLENLRKATYATLTQKVSILEESLLNIDSLRFFIQIAWETKIISNEQFISCAAEIEEIGKMVGGWRKGLLTKTPTI